MSENVIIQGIINDKVVIDKIQYNQFKTLINDYLEFGPYFQVMKDILINQMNYNIKEDVKTQISLADIFSTFNTLSFYKQVPSYLNSRITALNIKIIITSLIIFAKKLMKTNEDNHYYEDIKQAVLVFQLKEREQLKEGIPCEPVILNQMLKKINKTIYNKILLIWIEKCKPFLEVKDTLQTHEFLYLICNATNRRLFQNKLQKIPMEGNMDRKTRLFKFDNSLYKNLKNPDERIQNYMIQQYNMDQMNFIGMDIDNKEDANIIKKKQKIEEILKNEENGKLEEFKKLLKDPELLVEIKDKLKNFRQVLNHSKLSGKSLKYKIFEEIRQKEKDFFVTQDLIENDDENNKQQTKTSYNNLEKILDNNIYKKQQRQMLKPIDDKIIDEFAFEVQQQREVFKQQIQQEYQKSQKTIEIIKVTHPFLQNNDNKINKQFNRNKYKKIIEISRPQTSKTSNLIDDVLFQDQQEGKINDDNIQKNNNLKFYGTNKLSNQKNFQIKGTMCQTSNQNYQD